MGVGLKRVIKIASLVLAIIVTVLFLQSFVLVESNMNYTKVRGFYQEPQNSLDVVLMGSSDIYTAFSSGQAYGEQGFTSYPLAVEANPSDLWIYSLKEIQRTQDPQLVIIEINGALYPDPVPAQGYAYDDYLLDFAPLTHNKVEAVQGLDTDKPLPYFLPIVKYHNLWLGEEKPDDAAGAPPAGSSSPSDSSDTGNTTLDEEDGAPSAPPRRLVDADYFTLWLRGYSLLKGSSSFTISAPLYGELIDKQADHSTREMDPFYEQQLNQVMDYCQQNDIPLLFVRSVHRVTTKDRSLYRFYQRANRAEEIITQRGFPYLDLERYDGEMGIDYDTDFYNNGHLNAAGQQKFTSFLSSYLVEEYGIEPSALTGTQKKHWDKAARYSQLYQQYAIDLCNQGQDEFLAEGYEVISKLKTMDQESSR